MNPGLAIDHDALPETCHQDGHVDGCSGNAGGDHEYVRDDPPQRGETW